MTLERRFHGFGNLSQLPFRRPISAQVELYVSGQQGFRKRCQFHTFSFFTECPNLRGPSSSLTLLRDTRFHVPFSPFMFHSFETLALGKRSGGYIGVSVDEYKKLHNTRIYRDHVLH
ncbi:hypothetical protein D9757_012141 [Collybiopsis confluens]|uniref:Uncharacterized protein n=1 Tax=Collybiopsis confluens TaxID=2823264 RepID=A0A8H5LJM1_9AGAR|nr:hypothetical protein D9757_012141 [Collybiopsis confluens]